MRIRTLVLSASAATILLAACTPVDTYSSDEAFLTGTFGAQTPVAAVDGRPIGDGGFGPVTARIRALYADLVARDTAG